METYDTTPYRLFLEDPANHNKVKKLFETVFDEKLGFSRPKYTVFEVTGIRLRPVRVDIPNTARSKTPPAIGRKR